MHLDEEYTEWLKARGYDVLENFDNMTLWNEFVTIPSKNNFDDDDDDWITFDGTSDFLLTDEQRKEKRNAEKLIAEQNEQEYQQWRIDNRRFGSDNMNDYYDFMRKKEYDRWAIDFESDMK